MLGINRVLTRKSGTVSVLLSLGELRYFDILPYPSPPAYEPRSTTVTLGSLLRSLFLSSSEGMRPKDCSTVEEKVRPNVAQAIRPTPRNSLFRADKVR